MRYKINQRASNLRVYLKM